MSDTVRCTNCGTPLIASAAGDVCPTCLLKLGVQASAAEAPTTMGSTGARASHTPASTEAPAQIGPYRILEQLGEGGMGVVYLAEQERPLRRRVAVKVIKLGMDTRDVVARFEAERQALALMDHPNIASVFDAGATSDGRPYFVMEYVAGVAITEYCDRHRLSTRARLSLFGDVCAAVQHAHQKGIIHRDIKPSNVLVAIHDDHPVPKVIDFGVAKATAQHLTERTLFTQHGLFIGTPEYMSPEQAEMTGLDIDTRTDIYSLGVLLYELLVGAVPFDATRLRQAGYAEIQRILREEEPTRPSTRLSTLGATASDVAQRRRTSVPALSRELKGELDWITLKALEKDRTRRYASASELAADLTRYLADEPIFARPQSTAYRVRKFVTRHRAGVVAAAAIVLLLVAGLAATTTLYVRQQREGMRNRAEAAAFSAWAQDMQSRRSFLAYSELTHFIPLARDAIALERAALSEDLPAFIARLTTYSVLTSISHLSASEVDVPAPVHQFEVDLSRERQDVLQRMMKQGDARVLAYVSGYEGAIPETFSPQVEQFYLDAIPLARANAEVADQYGALMHATSQLRALSYLLVRDRGKSPDVYAHGLRLALGAFSARPDDDDVLETLAIARFRRGEFSEASAVLDRLAAARAKLSVKDLALSAVVAAKLGRWDAARVALEAADYQLAAERQQRAAMAVTSKWMTADDLEAELLADAHKLMQLK